MKMLRPFAAGLVLVLAFGGAFSLATSVLDRSPPIRYEAVRALSESVPQGGSIEVEFKVFRERKCDPTVTRWLTDAEYIRHSIPSYTFGSPGDVGPDKYVRTIKIPEIAAVGPAAYEVSIKYACNLLHRFGWPIVVDAPPITFNITPSTSLVPFSLPPLMSE